MPRVSQAPDPGHDRVAQRPAPTAPSRRSAHPLRTMVVDIVAPIGLYYGIRAAGGSVWLALAVGGIVPALSTLAGVVTRRHIDATGIMMVAALAVSAAFSLITGSPRALLARDGLVTAGWAGYMYLSLLASRPATFTVSRALLEGRRVFDSVSRSWVRPVNQSWDELWQRLPRFQHIWRICTVIWGTAILADAVIRVVMAYTLPIGLVPALGGALWPVTFIALQVVTNVYFARSGFWRILITGVEHERYLLTSVNT
ncbi:MAG: VC0807 family protein [Streptosporangiaceae bacterium]